MTETDKANRRRHRRHKDRRHHAQVCETDNSSPANRTLYTHLRRDGLALPLQEDIHFFDFSSAGFSFDSNNFFAIGEQLSLSISLEDYDRGQATELDVIICHRRKQDQGYHFGAYFRFDQQGNDSRHRQVVEHTHRHISQQGELF